jgi:aldose 1-epimerase
MKSDGGELLLEHGDMRLNLDVARGGALRSFDWRERPIFRPTAVGAGADPFDLACFPMLPYVNRIAHGRFRFGAHDVRLASNRLDQLHPLHGQAWLSPWRVLDASACSATLAFEGGADEWPWRYRAEQRLQLQQDVLTISLSVDNLSSSPMPLMLGLHPYFCDPAQARLQADLPRTWLIDDACLPLEEVATPPAWSFAQPRLIGAPPLDHCFTGWNGRARLHWPDCSVELRASHCPCLQVYAPAGRDFFCVEPLSAPVGALGRGAQEATVLAAGARHAIHVSFGVGVA